MKWVKPFAIGYEYVYIPNKVNNLTTERLLTLSAMIYIYIHRPRNNILSLEIMPCSVCIRL